MSGFFLSQQLPPNEMDVLSLNLLEWGMPEPCPFPQNRWGLGLGMLSTDVFIGRELIRRYLVHAENESLRCRVAGVIFYGSLKGGTMAIWLPFKCFSRTAEDINPNFWGLQRPSCFCSAYPSVKINFVFQFWVVFVTAKSGLQLTAGSAWTTRWRAREVQRNGWVFRDPPRVER